MPTGFSYRWIPQLQELEPNQLQDRTTSTHFAFRVFDDTSKAVYTKETGFTACTSLGGDFRDRPLQDLHRSVVSHVGRAQVESPWISASRLWDWAVWEMSRRQRRSSNTHLRVAVIDFRKFKSSSGFDFDPACIHALQFLNPLKEQSDYLKKLENFANIADEILFYGSIPACAVVSVVALEDVVHYVPGHNCKWLGSSSYRDSHWAMCHDHLHHWRWDADRYGLECAHLAWALLRTEYDDLRSLIWSIIFDVAGSSVSPPVNNVLVKLKRKGYPMNLVNPLVKKISKVLAVVKDTGRTPNPIALMGSRDYHLRIDLADGDLPITMLKLSLALSREGNIRDELHAAYIKTSALEPSKPSLLSDLEDCLQLIHVTAADLMGRIGVTISPDINLRIECARQKLKEFTDNFVALAASFPFSHIRSMRDRDWEILKLRIEEAAGLKLKWLHEILQLPCHPHATKQARWLEEPTYEGACRWFQP